MRGRASEGKGRRQHWPHKAPPTTATSNCSWGGKGCYMSGMGVGWRQGDGGEEGDKGHLYPMPLPQATARGVVMACKCAEMMGNRMTSTLCHCHEQLLMGWLWHASAWKQWEMGTRGREILPHALMTTQAHSATAASSRQHPSHSQGVFLLILFYLKVVVTAPLPVRRGVLLILRTLNRNVLGMY